MKMCRKVQCDKCKKWTWAGCGRHVLSALEGISKKDLCVCGKK